MCSVCRFVVLGRNLDTLLPVGRYEDSLHSMGQAFKVAGGKYHNVHTLHMVNLLKIYFIEHFSPAYQ
jgi:hypothetical protein